MITQNVDDLHERAGSHNVLHLHGELMKMRSVLDPGYIEPLDIDHLETTPATRGKNGDQHREGGRARCRSRRVCRDRNLSGCISRRRTDTLRKKGSPGLLHRPPSRRHLRHPGSGGDKGHGHRRNAHSDATTYGMPQREMTHRPHLHGVS